MTLPTKSSADAGSLPLPPYGIAGESSGIARSCLQLGLSTLASSRHRFLSPSTEPLHALLRGRQSPGPKADGPLLEKGEILGRPSSTLRNLRSLSLPTTTTLLRRKRPSRSFAGASWAEASTGMATCPSRRSQRPPFEAGARWQPCKGSLSPSSTTTLSFPKPSPTRPRRRLERTLPG